MNLNIKPNMTNLHEIVNNTKNSNNEIRSVRVDSSDNLKVRESKGNFLKFFGNKNARAAHREAAISTIKQTIQQEYNLSNDDINALMGGIKKKITTSDLKDLLKKSEEFNQTSIKAKEDKAIREAEIKSIKQQSSKSKAVSGLLKAVSISVPHLATTTYSELKKASTDSDLGIGKMISAIPKKIAKSEGKTWSQLDKTEKDFYINQVKNNPLDADFIDKLSSKLLFNEKFYDYIKASGNSGLLDAQVWNQGTLTDGKLAHKNGLCYGLVTSWALDISQVRISEHSDQSFRDYPITHFGLNRSLIP